MVSGTVKHEDGSTASGATVEVHNSTGDVVDQIRTTDAGFFTYYLSAGKWVFKMYDGEGRRGGKEVALDEVDGSFRVDLEIR